MDFTSYIEESPIVFEATTKQAFAYDCFKKLEFEFMYIVQEGKYRGLVSFSRSSHSGVILIKVQGGETTLYAICAKLALGSMNIVLLHVMRENLITAIS